MRPDGQRLHGGHGRRRACAEWRRQCHVQGTLSAQRALCAIPGVPLRYPGAISSTSSSRSCPGCRRRAGQALEDHGILGGLPVDGRHPVVRHGDGHRRAVLDDGRGRGEGGAEQMKLIFEKSVPGRRLQHPAPLRCAGRATAGRSCGAQKAAAPCRSWPRCDLCRHYTDAVPSSVHGVNDGFYPLGSCTMKYNPTHRRGDGGPAGLCRRASAAARGARRSGCLEVLRHAPRRCLTARSPAWTRMTFQPAAGAHGEFTGAAADQGRTTMHRGDHRAHQDHRARLAPTAPIPPPPPCAAIRW